MVDLILLLDRVKNFDNMAWKEGFHCIKFKIFSISKLFRSLTFLKKLQQHLKIFRQMCQNFQLLLRIKIKILLLVWSFYKTFLNSIEKLEYKLLIIILGLKKLNTYIFIFKNNFMGKFNFHFIIFCLEDKKLGRNLKSLKLSINIEKKIITERYIFSIFLFM